MLAQRIAQQEVLAKAVDLDRPGVKILGYRRIIHPELSRGGTCGLCIARRGSAVSRQRADADPQPLLLPIAAVTEDHDPADVLNKADLTQLYSDAGGTSAAHPHPGTRSTSTENSGRCWCRRSRTSRATRPSVLGPPLPRLHQRPSPRPTSLADSYLAWRRAWLTCGPGSLAEDSPQITYHLQQIDRLRANLQTGGDTPRRQTPREGDSSA